MRTSKSMLLLAAALLIACGDDDNPIDGNGGETPGAIDVPRPTSSTAASTRARAASRTPGQVVRNLLLQDLKNPHRQPGQGRRRAGLGAADARSLRYDDALDLESLTTTGDRPAVESRYSAISTGKSLSGKISGDVVIGYGRTADELVREWFEVIAANAGDADKLGTPAVYTDENGGGPDPDDQQGAHRRRALLPGHRGLSGGTAGPRQRRAPRRGQGLQLHGARLGRGLRLFGAARDYARYTDAQLGGSVGDYTFDSNGDGRIDFESEYNSGLSRNAGSGTGAAPGSTSAGTSSRPSWPGGP